MKMRTLLCTIIFAISSLLCASAQQSPYIFRHIGVANGLPDNYVKSVFRLPDGRLGIRTTVLLSLYDGGRFSNFPYNVRSGYYLDYSHSIPEQYIDKDNRLWMKERACLRLFDLTTEQYITNIDSLLSSFGLKEKIVNVFIDSAQRYWFVTVSSNIYVYDPLGAKKLRLVCRKDEFMEYNGGLACLESKGNYCWMVHGNGIIRCYDTIAGKFIRQENFLEGRIMQDEHVVMKILDNGDFWVMWDHGIYYYDIQSKKETEVKKLRNDERCIFTSLDVDGEGNAWLGTSGDGMYLLDRYRFSSLHVTEIPLLSGGYIKNDIHSICFDQQSKGLWIGFFNQGLCYYHPSMNKFPLFTPEMTKGKWANEDIRCMVEADDGKVLMGTTKGLQSYDPVSGIMDVPYPELATQICRVLYKDSKKRIWLGTFRNGLYCIDGGKIRQYLAPVLGCRTDPDYSNIRSMIEDKKGTIWVNVYGGLGRLNPEDGEITMLSDEFPLLKKYKVSNVLALDDKGRLVVGSDNGLFFYDSDKHSIWIPERDDPNNKLYIHESNKYNCIVKDSRGILWFGTQYGLNAITSRDNSIYTFGKEDGLSNTTIQSIQEDNNNDIWISTINSICKIEVKKQGGDYHFHVTCFASDTGVQRDDLYDFCSLKTKNGTLYFGRMNGFNAFTPENMVNNQPTSQPVFTSFRLFNTPILPRKEYNGRILLDKTINYTDHIELKYDENFMTIDFSGLNFASPSQTFFRYKLEELDKEWIEVVSEGGQGRATYSNLPSGNYVFIVQTAGNDKAWGPESKLHLTIHPPFWKTLTAWIIYLILICLAIYGLVVYLNNRNRSKLARMKEEETIKQKEELDQMKFRFFTNISHELRTPLTLIITPLDMLKRKVTDDSVKKQLNSIYRNAQELLTLVNQLLDFRKLEMKGEKLRLANGDMEEFVLSIYSSFIPVSIEKQFEYVNEKLNRALYMYFDRDKVHKIVNNLLSNAFKFTPDGGRIVLSLSTEEQKGRTYAKIEVADTGIGIPETELPFIFNRFYQVQNHEEEWLGSGIGLHLIKEYVDIHEGKVSVSSHAGHGSTFTVWIPIDLKPGDETYQEGAEIEESVAEPTSVNSDNRKKLLIVEDNTEFRIFMKEQLSERYQIVEASDGEEGEKCAVVENPDLIISDIMMPKVDGIELCRRIKTNVQTSHIPVILLTARTADDVKINSYEVGADSYMSKPFNFDMLLVRIEKLIEQQDSRKREFSKSIEVNPSTITITSLDKQLIQKALQCIENHIDDTSYAVEDLSRDLGMTRMNLYRKLQSITGHTPSDFIKSIRLKRAAQLLKDSQLTVGEVADRVGFSSASYFTKCFKEMFGVIPTQYGGK